MEACSSVEVPRRGAAPGCFGLPPLAAVESGNADAGIVYRTDAAISRRVRVALEVPADEAPRIVYPAALVGDAPGPAARAFYEHLRSPGARLVFERLGFECLPAR